MAPKNESPTSVPADLLFDPNQSGPMADAVAAHSRVVGARPAGVASQDANRKQPITSGHQRNSPGIKDAPGPRFATRPLTGRPAWTLGSSTASTWTMRRTPGSRQRTHLAGSPEAPLVRRSWVAAQARLRSLSTSSICGSPGSTRSWQHSEPAHDRPALEERLG